MLATPWDANMKWLDNWMVEFMFIPGFCVGFEFYKVGEVCDEEGYINFDLGIVRFLFTYSKND